MTIETVMLPLFLTAIAVVTLWNIIGAKGHWGIKAGVMVFVSSLCIWVWISLSAMIGWPLDQIPTGTYDLAWVEVVEPNKSKDIHGGIYIWIKNMDKTDKHDLFQQQEQHMSQRKPRAYGLPYSRELHKQMVQIKSDLKKGQRIRATIKAKDLKKGNDPNSIEQEPDIKFHKLPPPKPPKFFQSQPQQPQQPQPTSPQA